MAYADQQMSGNKVVAIIIVALIHVAIGYALITGLAYSAAKQLVERVTTVDIEEPPPPEDEPPPPPEPDTAPPPPVAPPPPISINVAPPPIQVQTTIPPPAPPQRIVPPAAPPAPPPSRARAAQRENFSRWQRQIVGEGYPSRAIRQEIEGTVGVSVVIGPNGRVSSCRVTRPSGESVLDDAACRSMERYARYEPALDDAGNPTTGNDSINIVYQLN